MMLLMWAFVSYTLIIPHIAITGASIIILSSMVVTICTCWISFVALVIRDDVWKRSISEPEYAITVSNTLDLRFLPMLAPTLDDMRDTSAARTIITIARRSIRNPQDHR